MPSFPAVSEIAAGDPQAIANELNVPIIWVDHQATRRQRLHGASIPGKPTSYSSSHMNECLEAIAEAGYETAIFICQTPAGEHLACYIEFSVLE